MIYNVFNALVSVLALGLVAAEVGESFHPKLSDIQSKVNSLNLTTGGPYTYSQSGHHFYGTAYDGSYIDTRDACSGANDSCRDNPDCQCIVSINFVLNSRIKRIIA